MADKDTEEKVLCTICTKRVATEKMIRPFEVKPVPVCTKCYNDSIDEEE